MNGSMELANGSVYGVTASHPRVEDYVELFIKTMGMRDRFPTDVVVRVLPIATQSRLAPSPLNQQSYYAERKVEPGSPLAPIDSDEGERDSDTVETIPFYWESDDKSGTPIQLQRLSLTLVRRAERDGALLLHAGLVADETGGVLLAGPSGAGKSTATERIPSPWRGLSDDLSLVVADRSGKYWAHPWPTWSTFDNGGQGGMWEVSQAVPLRGVFFLTKGTRDRVTPISGGEAVCALNANVREASMIRLLDLSPADVRESNLRRFENVCRLAESVPVHNLQLGMFGAFWKKIERSCNLCEIADQSSPPL
jgi:SynChlorMet cassette protein ScmC